MEWFNQDVQNRGQKPEVDVVLDRGPRPNSLPEYAVDDFTLPGVALFLLSLVLVYVQPKIVTALPDYFYSVNTEEVTIDVEDPNVIDPSFFSE